jgi:hypothetical protein
MSTNKHQQKNKLFNSYYKKYRELLDSYFDDESGFIMFIDKFVDTVFKENLEDDPQKIEDRFMIFTRNCLLNHNIKKEKQIDAILEKIFPKKVANNIQAFIPSISPARKENLKKVQEIDQLYKKKSQPSSQPSSEPPLTSSDSTEHLNLDPVFQQIEQALINDEFLTDDELIDLYLEFAQSLYPHVSTEALEYFIRDSIPAIRRRIIQGSGRPKKQNKSRKPNQWIQFVKSFASKYNISYSAAISNPNCKNQYHQLKNPSNSKVSHYIAQSFFNTIPKKTKSLKNKKIHTANQSNIYYIQ